MIKRNVTFFSGSKIEGDDPRGRKLGPVRIGKVKKGQTLLMGKSRENRQGRQQDWFVHLELVEEQNTMFKLQFLKNPAKLQSHFRYKKEILSRVWS